MIAIIIVKPYNTFSVPLDLDPLMQQALLLLRMKIALWNSELTCVNVLRDY